MPSSEFVVSILCLVALLLLSWAILLHARVKVLQDQINALKHYINTKKKLEQT